MGEYCYINGEIVRTKDAKVSVMDIGMLRGYGIYEGITTTNGTPFHFAEHWQRFVDSAHFLGLNIPITEEKCEKVIKELYQKNGYKSRANIRMILTGGPAIGGIEFDFKNPTFYIVLEDFVSIPEHNFSEGAKLLTYKYKRKLPKIKHLDYIVAVNLQNWRKEEKALEILYVEDGEVYECSTSNIFLVKDGKIITPAEGVLDGITRKVVKDLVDVEEQIVLEDDLRDADEVFISSSFKDIVPVTKIDDWQVGDGIVGAVTKDVMQKFAKELNMG